MGISLIEVIRNIFSNNYYFIVVLLLSGVILANGCTDSQNTIATCVSTRSISPRRALIMATIFNFLGIFTMSLINVEVVKTVFDIVDFGDNAQVALVALVGALISIVCWALFSGKTGIPTSESHALIAAITGSAIALKGSFSAINGHEWLKVLAGIVISIIGGFTIGYVAAKIVENILKNYDRRRTKRFFKSLQIFGGAALSFMHGAQAGQKFIGVFLLGTVFLNGSTGSLNFDIPIWLMIYCSLLMAIGTSLGGYKVIKTIGMKMSNLELYQGAIADVTTSGCLLLSSIFGIPVSTAHTKSSVIMGVGASKRLKNINWNIVKRILLAGIITFPCCGGLAFIITKIALMFF